MRILKQISSILLVSTAAAVLSGCAVGPNFKRPAPPNVTGYIAEPLPAQTAAADTIGGDAQRFLQDTDISAQWWTDFHSEVLNQLIAQALKANPDLEAAQASLRQADETYIAAKGPLYPQITTSDSATHQKSSSSGKVLDLFNASVSVSYIFDVFGGVQRTIEASRALQENQRYQLEATYLTLISNVITAAIQQAAISGQIAATQDIIAAQSQELDLLNQQFELGAVARGDVLAQQSQLAATQASLPPLQKQLAQVRNSLSVLLGRFPSENQIPLVQFADLQLPKDLPLSVPSKLIEQRPDIRASEALLHQASANIGIAAANQLPQFTLTASGSDSANYLKQLTDPSSLFWSVGAGLTAPIFKGGTLAAQKRGAIDAYDKASAQYRSVVLNGFANVANVLAALQLDAETLRVQLYAETTAQQALEITTERFQAGAIPYLSLLDAQRTYQQARIALVLAQANRFADTVALYQALGGGWWNRDDVAEAERREHVTP